MASYENPWLNYTGTGNPYAGLITPPAAGAVPPGADAGGKKKFDPEKLKKWAPLIAALASAALSPKGYRWAGAGAAVRSIDARALQEEERKRYEAEQNWLNVQRDWARQDRDLAAEERARQEEQRKRWEELANRLGNDLIALGPTPEITGIMATEKTPELTLGGQFGEQPDPWKITAPEIEARTVTTPAKPGDPTAKYIGEIVKASGGNPETIMWGLGYLAKAETNPKARRNVEMLLKTLSPGNRWIPMLLQEDLTVEEFDKIATEAIKWEEENKGLTPEEMEKLRLDLDLKRAQIAAANRSNQPKSDKKDDSEDGGLKVDPVRLQTQYDDYLAAEKAKGTDSGKIRSFEAWVRWQYGEPTLQAYNKKVAGSPQPSGTSQTGKNLGYTKNEVYTYDDWVYADELIRNAPSGKKDANGKPIMGSITNAIIAAIRRYEAGQEDAAVVMALIDRWNRTHPPKDQRGVGDWYKIAGITPKKRK